VTGRGRRQTRLLRAGLLGSVLITAALPAAVLLCTPTAWALVVPPLTKPVVDTADMVDAATERQLDAELQRLWKAGGSQIAVLTVPNLDGTTIEQAAIQVAEQWKLGTKDRDNGVILMLARDDRALRIEVGQGLEGDLPDAYAKRIIDQAIVPELKGGRPGRGIMNGVVAIARRTDPDWKWQDASMTTARRTNRPTSVVGGWIKLGVFLIMLALMSVSRLMGAMPGRRGAFGRSLGGFGGGGFGGGGFGGGGFGGGGFGGGGGGFSGGGSSGRW
jgi:uncharacterized protein